jgi:hypothetical protein
MRANIVGPPEVATRIKASIAACHFAASCSAFRHGCVQVQESSVLDRKQTRFSTGSNAIFANAMATETAMATRTSPLTALEIFIVVSRMKGSLGHALSSRRSNCQGSRCILSFTRGGQLWGAPWMRSNGGGYFSDPRPQMRMGAATARLR